MKKVTKKERKLAKGPNAASLRSIKTGKEVLVGGRMYMGANPTFHEVIEQESGSKSILKVVGGMPFVRVA